MILIQADLDLTDSGIPESNDGCYIWSEAGSYFYIIAFEK